MTQRSPRPAPASRRTGRPPSVGDSGIVRRTMLGLDEALDARVESFRADIDALVPGNALSHPDILRMLIIKGLEAVTAEKRNKAQLTLSLESTTTNAPKS